VYSVRILQSIQEKFEYKILAGMGLTFCLGFILSPYGDDPSGRYFLPLILPMAVFGAKTINDVLQNNKLFQAGVVLLILIYQVGGIWQSARNFPPGITTQFDKVTQIDHRYLPDLVDFLDQEGLTRGYTNYWVSYPLAFLSDEELIFIPRLPYHEDFRYTARDDRYLPYTEEVKKSDKIGYITTNHEELNEFLRERFQEQGISWQEKLIGDYLVFYDLSEPIHVIEIGLGQTTTP
jgi:hypothetical protein